MLKDTGLLSASQAVLLSYLIETEEEEEGPSPRSQSWWEQNQIHTQAACLLGTPVGGRSQAKGLAVAGWRSSDLRVPWDSTDVSPQGLETDLGVILC